MNKKAQQLGMNPSTASHRLVKDLLFKMVCDTEQNKCFQCGEPMERNNFSIEHKTPWLDSENPQELFFNLENIAFSHLKCNVQNARRAKSECGTSRSYNKGCRCEECKSAKREKYANYYSTEKRQARYSQTGK